MFEKVNTIDKYGVRQRILKETQILAELLLIDVFYKEAIFYVTDREGKLIGSIEKRQLAELGLEVLTPEISLKDVCAMIPKHFCHIMSESLLGEKDEITFEYDELVKLNEYFSNDQNLIEIPITDHNGLLIAVIDKARLYARILDLNTHEYEPVISWGFKKRYEPTHNTLNKYACDINSQWGEDGIIEKIFEIIGFETKYAVEFGGWDGIYLSNIRNLITKHGFSAMFIEGDQDKAEECAENYSEYSNVKCVNGYVGFDKYKKLDEFLEENGAPKDFDLLSIDIDGYDYYVWDSLKNYSPRVVIVEYNWSMSNDVLVFQPKNEGIFQGSSASALEFLSMIKGYSLVAMTTSNCIFVKDDEYEKFKILDNSLDALRGETHICDCQYFQTYDRSIYYQGINFFHWTSRAPDQTEFFKSKKFQLIDFQTKL